MGLAAAAPAGQKSIHDGVFTQDQVRAGEELYLDVCLECHAKDTFGPDYMEGWSGASVRELFELVQATMPYENPGSLEGKQYADVLAYLFNLNGVAAGEAELPAEVGKLREINIAGPFNWNGRQR